MIEVNKAVFYILFFILGMLAGGVYVGGLWFTVRKLIVCKNAIVWMLLSYIIRFTVIGFCFYTAATAGGWIEVLICFSGFLFIRVLIVNRIRANRAEDNQVKGKLWK